MTTYIENVITDVSVEAEKPEDHREVDQRWVQERKILAAIKSQSQQQRRVASEGFDD